MSPWRRRPTCWTLISLFSKSQHIAFGATLLVLFVAWRVVRGARGRRRRARALSRGSPRSRLTAGALEVLAFAGFLAALLALYATAALVPRPTAALAVDDPDDVVVDFHSHTSYSHDGRAGWTPERNRAWHAAAGYDAVYVTDHSTWEGWRNAQAGNPPMAGDGTTLLPGVEMVTLRAHAAALGPPADYPPVHGRDWSPDSLRAFVAAGGPAPVLVFTLPGQTDSVVARTASRPVGYVAIELNDAAPRGLEDDRVRHARIVRLADSLDLAVVASSNNHGWGRTAAAWSLMSVPGWQTMRPVQLDAAVRSTLVFRRRQAVRVVERWIPVTEGSVWRTALVVPIVGWGMLQTLSVPERTAWIVLLVGAALLVGWRRARPRRP